MAALQKVILTILGENAVRLPETSHCPDGSTEIHVTGASCPQ